jgi:lipopolysaccharide/colanic/teichoic acid biosynthesis glycosyltransferase
MIKRVFDLAVASSAIIVASPVMLAAAVAVKFSSPGPIIFSQERVGLNGVPFKIHKFRTMHQDPGGGALSPSCDSRVTKIGRLLRRSKIDELPQLYDVVRGRMSLVGPRPEVRQYVDAWPRDLRPIILSVKPGITDPASIKFRNEGDELARTMDPELYYTDTILPEKVTLYAQYVNSQSFVRDVLILARTINAVVFRPRSS